ncbi:unnamed protein product [Mytilus coruscus]|uniref:Uncharacterized protein n=1 Tax=Mytilus coruscus TaxID=42192 RepID=A0A6J8BVV6_MYTCO|nr:unnamed protein product [Mytilus coruscus]
MWYSHPPIIIFSRFQFDVSSYYHSLLHESRETKKGCLANLSETTLCELLHQCNAADSIYSRDMFQLVLDILKERIYRHNAMLMLSRSSLSTVNENPPSDGLDRAAINGTMKLNLGLDELDDLFSLRGHLESLTAYFTQPHPHQQQQVVSKENVVPIYTPPPTPSVILQAPPAIMNGNEASTFQALLRSIQDPMWSKGNQIPMRVATKRLREDLQPQWSARGFKYEPILPVKSELYELSEEETERGLHGKVSKAKPRIQHQNIKQQASEAVDDYINRILAQTADSKMTRSCRYCNASGPKDTSTVFGGSNNSGENSTNDYSKTHRKFNCTGSQHSQIYLNRS